MPSTENTTLSRIQQEIQDVVNREAELKKLNGNTYHSSSDSNNNEDEGEEQKTTLTRIQEEIQNVLDRERELRELKKSASQNNGLVNNGSAAEANNNDLEEDARSNHSAYSNTTAKSGDEVDQAETASRPEVEIVPVVKEFKEITEMKESQVAKVTKAPLLRTVSTSVLEEHQRPPAPHFRRVVSSAPNPNKGVMHRFLKSRGKLAAVASLALQKAKTPFHNAPAGAGATNGFRAAAPNHYEHAPPKVTPASHGQFVRKNYIPTDQKIKQDIETSYKRETELKTLRQSQGNIAQLDESALDAPLDNYGLRLSSSRSMAQLYVSEEALDEPAPSASAPSSLKPAKSLAQLCDAKDEEVTSPQALITHFQQMIIKNQESKRT